jgi:hypothetical protein
VTVGWERVGPEPEPIPLPAPARARGRPLFWIVAALAVAAIALTWVIASWIRFAPLEPGGSAGASIEPTSSAYAFAIENTGRFDLQVTGIELPEVPGYFWSPKVEVGEPGASVGDPREPRHAFEPFTLPAGAERAIILSGKTSCAKGEAGQTMSLGAVRVEYKVLGISRAQTVGLLGGYQLNPLPEDCAPPPPPPGPLAPNPTNSRQ